VRHWDVSTSAAVNRLLAWVAVGPLLVRGVGFAAGQVALLLSVPAALRDPQIVLAMLVLAGVTAVFPASRWVSVLEYLAVGAWFATTTLQLYEVTPARVVGLAAAVYLHHSACALAAVTPVDGVVAPRVLVEWLLRTGFVLAASVPLGLLALSLPGLLGRSGQVVVPVLGLAALVLAGLGLVHLAQRAR
jgi:hypothetical protein